MFDFKQKKTILFHVTMVKHLGSVSYSLVMELLKNKRDSQQVGLNSKLESNKLSWDQTESLGGGGQILIRGF